MKKLFVVMFLVFFLPSLSVGEDRAAWTATDTAVQAAFVAITIIDWEQTRTFTCDQDNDYHKDETSPLLGDHPSKQKIDLVFGAGILAHTAIAYLLPHPYRTYWQSFWIGVETEAVYSNYYKAGIRFRF